MTTSTPDFQATRGPGSRATSGWRRLTIALSAAGLALGLAAPARGASGQTGTDTLYVYTQSGIVQGTITPSAAFTVEVKTGTVRKNLVSGRASSTGVYSAAAGYHDGVGMGAHNGDTYIVTDQSNGRKYSQAIQLSAVLDERTGTLVGKARPYAQVALTLARVNYAAGVVAAATVQADAAGSFRYDWAAVHTPAPQPTRPAWRGYTVTLEGRDVANQGTYRSIQTAAPGLNWTANSGGGGYFEPGDAVTHELWNGGVKRASVATTVNADGVPRSTFPVDVIDGDVFRTRYHDTSGVEQTIDLQPYSFSATADVTARTVSGFAAPNAPIVAILANAAGDDIKKTWSDSNGFYSVSFEAMDWGRMLTVYRGADEGYTGIGMHAITMYTPIVRVDDLTGSVTGYGTPGAGPASVTVRRNGQTVETASGSNTRSGKFSATLVNELVPGDTLSVATNGVALPSLSIGSFTVHRSSTETTAPMEGKAPAGHFVTVGSASCSVSATANSSGSWSASGPCGFQPTDYVLELESDGAGPNLGSVVGRYQWVTSPDVALSSPAPLGKVSGSVTLSADSFDYDDNKLPAEVRFVVDGKTVAVDTTAPYTATVTLAKGAHRTWAYAIDSARRVAPDGRIIAGTTPARSFTVL